VYCSLARFTHCSRKGHTPPQKCVSSTVASSEVHQCAEAKKRVNFTCVYIQPAARIQAFFSISRTLGLNKEGNSHESAGRGGGEKDRRAKFMRCRERRGKRKACGWAKKEQDQREGATCTPIHRKKIWRETLQILLRVPPPPSHANSSQNSSQYVQYVCMSAFCLGDHFCFVK